MRSRLCHLASRELRIKSEAEQRLGAPLILLKSSRLEDNVRLQGYRGSGWF